MEERLDRNRITRENLLYEEVMRGIAALGGMPDERGTLDGLADTDVWDEMRKELTHLQKLVTKEYDPGHIYDVLLAIIKALKILMERR